MIDFRQPTHPTPEVPVMSKTLELTENALYIFYTTDPDDRRVDDAFVGRFIGWSTPGSANVQEVSLIPGDDRAMPKRHLTGMYSAHPLPPPAAPVWQVLPRLLVPPSGWPAGLQTSKGLKDGDQAITVAKVMPRGAAVDLTVDVGSLPVPLVTEVCRLLLNAAMAT